MISTVHFHTLFNTVHDICLQNWVLVSCDGSTSALQNHSKRRTKCWGTHFVINKQIAIRMRCHEKALDVWNMRYCSAPTAETQCRSVTTICWQYANLLNLTNKFQTIWNPIWNFKSRHIKVNFSFIILWEKILRQEDSCVLVFSAIQANLNRESILNADVSPAYIGLTPRVTNDL